MNLAFTAVVILLVAMPGVIFVRQNARANRDRLKRDFGQEFVGGIAFTLIAHLIWIHLFSFGGWLCGRAGWDDLEVSPDVRSAIVLASGRDSKPEVDNKKPEDENKKPEDENRESTTFAAAVDSVANYPGSVAAYFVTIYLASYFVGHKARWFWYEIVRGRETPAAEGSPVEEAWRKILLLGTNREDRPVAPDGGAVDIMLTADVVLGGKLYLYQGLYKSVQYDAEGDLLWIELEAPERRELEPNKEDVERLTLWTGGEPAGSGFSAPFKEIESDSFVVWLKDTRTLNVIYFYVPEDGGSRLRGIPRLAQRVAGYVSHWAGRTRLYPGY